MSEAVRLVVWDLDETFWKGTVTEGGIEEYIQANHDIVIELARRGIMSSICSKNDMATILAILEEKGILEYFIFPSISWESKGMRLASLIETVGLRPPTVMFIDDNPNNRAEAAAIVPEMQIEDEHFVPRILDDPRFKGKDDSGLSRLKQYKLLEARKQDEQKSSGDNAAFLRSCDVRVYIEYDVASNIDRAIELINRTNQLNYTKLRLPEDMVAARRKLTWQMNDFNRQAGLVRVIDNYGDYGFVGFFLTKNMRKNPVPGEANSVLEHYCFSCRTLGMLVEQWLYEHLRRPELTVSGEVLTDLSVPRDIDWIRLVSSVDEVDAGLPQIAPKILVAGGCEANSIGVYLNAYTPELEVFGNFEANGLFLRVNSSVAILETSSVSLDVIDAEADRLGVPRYLSAVDFFGSAPQGTAYVFNCSRDAENAFYYRHKTTGWVLCIEPRPLPGWNVFATSEEELHERLDKADYPDEQRESVKRICRHIRENYVVYRPTEAERLQSMRDLIARIPNGSKLIIAVDHDMRRERNTEWHKLPRLTQYAVRMRELAAEFPHVGVVAYTDVIESQDEILNGGNHYRRVVYLRFAQRVVEVLGELQPKGELVLL